MSDYDPPCRCEECYPRYCKNCSKNIGTRDYDFCSDDCMLRYEDNRDDASN